MNHAKQVTADKIKALESKIPGSIVRTSKKKVKYLFVKLDWTVCYYYKTNTFRVFHKHFKHSDLASVDDVVQFFETLNENA